MTDMSTEDRAVDSSGQTQSSVISTSTTNVDPATGASLRRNTTRGWSGRAPGVEFGWLIAGVVLNVLGLDCIFRASRANSVGFAALLFSFGKFLAAPLAGIFKTAAVVRGDVVA
jgi:hypothetical protein